MTQPLPELRAVPDRWQNLAARVLAESIGAAAQQHYYSGDELKQRAADLADALSIGLNRISSGPDCGNTQLASDEQQ